MTTLDTTTAALLADYHQAVDRQAWLERGWFWTRLLVWPATVIGIASTVIALTVQDGFPLWLTLLAIAGLLFSLGHIELLRKADTAVADSWDALAEHTGLSEDELVRLVDGGESEGEA